MPMVAFLYYPPKFIERLTFDVLKEQSRKTCEAPEEPRIIPISP